FRALGTGGVVLEGGRRSFGFLGQFRPANRRLGRLRAFPPVHGTADPVAPSRSSPNTGLGGYNRRAGPWSGASPWAVYQVVRTPEWNSPAPVCLWDEHGNRD